MDINIHTYVDVLLLRVDESPGWRRLNRIQWQ